MSQDVRVKKMRGTGYVVAALAVVVLAACGSSKSTASPAAQPSASSGATTAPASPSATTTVMTATNAKLGTIMVDAAGKTLYTLTNAGSPVACTGQCLTFWPPLLLPSGTTAPTGASGVTGLGTVKAAGGTQVTAGGDPLYHFSGDSAAGDTNGEGVSSFGGTWHAAKAGGASGAVASTATTMPATATTPTTSGYGY